MSGIEGQDSLKVENDNGSNMDIEQTYSLSCDAADTVFYRNNPDLLCFFELEYRVCSSDFSNNCESMTRHSPCRQETLMLKATWAISMPHQRNH